jgi:hypothetical protein
MHRAWNPVRGTTFLTLLAVSACGGEASVEGAEASRDAGADDSRSQVVRLVPDGRYDESFGLIQTVRELPDGRVLIADPLGKTLQALDLDAGEAEPIGSEGQGPDEYRQPDAVWPLPGDRTLLVDLGNARLTVMGPDLEFGRTYPVSAGRPGPGGGDREGRVYFQSLGMAPGGRLPENGTIMRWDPESDEVVEIGQVKLPERQVTESGGPNSRNQQIRQIPLSLADGWAVAPDGRVAVARAAEGYRVDWIQPDGRTLRGAEQEYRPVPIGTAEKEEWVETSAQRGGGLSISVEMENDRTRMSFQRGGSDRPDISGYAWPERKPPFDPDEVVVDQQGRAWVRAHRRAGQPPLYHVFDGNGDLVTQVEMEAGQRVVGFGEGTVYVVRVDEFDLQYLERYRLG